MPKQTLCSDAARAALLRGVDAVANPVKVTLGPRGRNVLIDRPGQPIATRDGVTVAKECADLPDPFENMGAQYAREVADAAVVESGDGTTTATVILQAIFKGGCELLSAGAEPLHLADGIESAAKACAETIKQLAIPATEELVRQAAIISTHGDVELGTVIADTAWKVGASGVIELQESRDSKTHVEFMEGFYFERGWRGVNGANLVFVNDKSGQKSILPNPYVLISERTIVGFNDKLQGDHLYNVVNQCVKARRPLLIIADDLIGDAYNAFTANIAAGALVGGCFVKLPGFAEMRSAAIKDLAIAVGAKRVHSLASTRVDDVLSTFTLDDLGNCKQAIITPTRTVLIEGASSAETISKRVSQLAAQKAESSNPFEVEQLDHRIARLTGGVAILKVGAHSEPVMLEKKARAEDAIHACRAALQDGLVPGGGVALLRAVTKFEQEFANYVEENGPSNKPSDELKGWQILLNAIQEPARQIVRNTGHGSPDQIVAAVMCVTGKPSWGFNAATGKAGDLYEMGIVDPAKVVLTALRKASSIGALLLTTEVLVTDIPQHQQVLTPKADFRY
jgi:chaperonin GroEL